MTGPFQAPREPDGRSLQHLHPRSNAGPSRSTQEGFQTGKDALGTRDDRHPSASEWASPRILPLAFLRWTGTDIATRPANWPQDIEQSSDGRTGQQRADPPKHCEHLDQGVPHRRSEVSVRARAVVGQAQGVLWGEAPAIRWSGTLTDASFGVVFRTLPTNRPRPRGQRLLLEVSLHGSLDSGR
ncbi:hypothetical protein D3C78_1249340 [compost metagenome]